MRNPFVDFAFKATLLLLVAYCIHILVLHAFSLPLFDNNVILSYSINYVLIIAVFGFLYLMRNKYKSQLGFLFLAGSLLKFAVFFIVFYPIFREDDQMSKLEFASFFVPYGMGLFLETLSLSKWLNKLE
jgi:O-antigen ligase